MATEEKVVSKVEMNSCSYSWNIESFTLVCSNPNDEPENENAPFEEDYQPGFVGSHYKCLLDIDFVQSSTFYVGENELATNWYMFMKKQSRWAENISIYLHLDSGPANTLIKYKLSILDPKGTPVYQSRKSGIVNLDPDNFTGESAFISISRLYAEKDLMLEGDVLRLKLDLQVIQDIVHFQDVETTEVEPPPNQETSPLLQNIWETKAYSDMVLQVGEVTFLAHKFIVGTASPYLADKIGNQPEPKPRLILANIDPVTLKSVLEYIYTGNISGMEWNNSELVTDILEAARTLQMDALLNFCFYTLSTNHLTLKSVSFFVVLTHAFPTPQPYKTKILKFCAENIKRLKDHPEHKRISEECPAAFLQLLYI